jgi:hypothetical protein
VSEFVKKPLSMLKHHVPIAAYPFISQQRQTSFPDILDQGAFSIVQVFP